MFGPRYFALRYFPGRYFPVGGATAVPPTADGLQYRILGIPFHMQAGGARTHYRAPGEPFHYQDEDP